MEDIKRRLNFADSAIRVQAVGKLVTQLCNREDDGQPPYSSSSNTTSPELELLWAHCGSGDVVVASACCEALVTLVRRHRANYSYVLTGLINQAPSARNLSSIVKAIGDLLVMQYLVERQEGNFVTKYSIRSPPHPFITVLTNRNDSWPVLLLEVESLLSHPDLSVEEDVIDLLSPFLKFVLLEPQQNHRQMRMAVINSLIESNIKSVTLFLIDILPCLQLRDNSQILYSCFLIKSIKTAGSSHLDFGDGHLERLLLAVVYLTKKAINNGLDIRSMLKLIEEILAGHNNLINSSVLMAIITLLPVVPVGNSTLLLNIVKQALAHGDGVSELVVAMLAVPCLHLVATPHTTGQPAAASQKQAAADVMLQVQQRLLQQCSASTQHAASNIYIVDDGYFSETFIKHFHSVAANEESKLRWLQSLPQWLKGMTDVPFEVLSLVGSVMVTAKDEEIMSAALDALVAIAVNDQSKGPSILPLLLYELGKQAREECKLKILLALPKVATHKVVVGPVLRTLQVLGRGANKALALRLLCSLWQQQDRCFPQLQQAVLEKDFATRAPLLGGVDEVLVAKAACIRDICRVRPSRGEDMLGALSAILNEHGEAASEAVGLALEGLYHLCEAEVVDVQTAWSVLASALSKDTRPLVVQQICRIFSLVPSLEVETEEYEEFMGEVVSRLWGYMAHSDSRVVRAACSALAAFSQQHFNITHLPAQVTSEIMSAAKLAAEEAAKSGPQGFEYEAELPPISGICYMHILKLLPADCLSAYEQLLSSLISTEVSELPRGAFSGGASNLVPRQALDSGLDTLPQLLQRQYDQNRQPGLRSALAGTLLLGYDPVLPVNKEGKAKKTEIIKFGRSYHQMLYTLLQEVTLYAADDWERSVVSSTAWTLFMDRCFHAYLQCRTAELAVELEKGKADDPEENRFRQDTAWIWARDKLTDLIKSVSRGSPNVQGNCVVALSGLAVVSTKFANNLDADSAAKAAEATEHLGQAHWLSVVTNTVLAILDFQYQPTARTLQICQQRGDSERSPASLLARAGACLALPPLIPLLITSHADLVATALTALTAQLPTATAATETQAGRDATDTAQPKVIQFHHGLGLGLVLAALFEERYSDIAGPQGMINVWQAVQSLETAGLSAPTGGGGDRLGCLLGLAACFPAMCHEGRLDTKAHVAIMFEQLVTRLETSSVQDEAFEGLCLCTAYLAAAAYSTNILDQISVNKVVATIYRLHSQNLEHCGVSLALGAVCCGLGAASHPTVGDLAAQLYSSWIAALQEPAGAGAEDASLRRAALKGVFALAGSQALTLQVENGGEAANIGVKMKEVIKVASKDQSGGGGELKHSSWMLALLYQASKTANSSRSSVPMTYTYLPDTSVLKASVQLLHDAGKTGVSVFPPDHVKLLMRAILASSSQSLPPVNWGGLLSPIIRGGFGDEIEALCLRLAVSQSANSPSAALFVSSWLLSPLYDTLKRNGRLALYESLPTLIKTISPAKLKEYFERGFIRTFSSGNSEAASQDGGDIDSEVAALKGLCSALRVHDPPQMVTLVLYEALQAVYHAIDSNVEFVLAALCECLRQVPDVLLDRIYAIPIPAAKNLYSRCYLVANGSQPLTWLNPAIESTAKEQHGHNVSLHQILCCLWQYQQQQQELKQQQQQLGHNAAVAAVRHKWMLELMGFIRNVATGKHENQQMLSYLIAVYSASVLAWSRHKALAFFPGYDKFSMGMSSTVTTDYEDIKSTLHRLLPCVLKDFLSKEINKSLTIKVIEWLLLLCESHVTKSQPELDLMFKACLYALRHTKEFSSMSKWSRVFAL